MNLFMICISIFMAITVMPHIFRMLQTKSSRDQSIIGITGVAIGILCWIGYGLHVEDYTIVICNIILGTIQFAYLTTAVYFRGLICGTRKN